MVMNDVGGPQVADEKDLGLRLQTARKAAGFTQQELCQKANLAYSTLAKIERGAIKSPSVFTIQSIAEVLGTSLDELMGLKTAVVTATTTVKKVSKSGIRFVYFDINGCLVRFFHQAFTRVAQDTGRSAEAIESAFWHYNDAVCRGDMTMEQFDQALAERLQLPSLDWKKYYMAAVEPIPEMQELLPWVAEHYEVGLLSNISPGFIKDMLESKLLPQINYRCIIDSSEVKAIKPEPQIYQIAQDRAAVKPQEILLMDDSRANLMAAEKMGWHVLWFDDYRPSESAARIREALAFADETPAPPAPVTTPVTEPAPATPAPTSSDYVLSRGSPSYEPRV